MKEEMGKIEVFIPHSHVDALREALHQAGAGRIGQYDHCVSITEVTGYWRPLDGADPYDGVVGNVSQGSECKVEVNCTLRRVPAVVQAIRDVHPYEEPVINILILANHLYLP